jgi:hypothetical protein
MMTVAFFATSRNTRRDKQGAQVWGRADDP